PLFLHLSLHYALPISFRRFSDLFPRKWFHLTSQISHVGVRERAGQQLVDDRLEVGQRADRRQGQRPGRPQQPPQRTQQESRFNQIQRDAPELEFGGAFLIV